MKDFVMQFYSEFMHIYFWVFLVFFVLICAWASTDEHDIAKEYAIKKGRYMTETKFMSLVAWVLWFMSWKY